MKMKKTVLITLLCLLLCVSLLPAAAFADQTVVIVGGAIQSDNTVVSRSTTSQGSTVIPSGPAAGIVADSASGNVIVSGSDADLSSAVIVMPNGSVVTPQKTQTVTTETTAQTQVTAARVAGLAPAGLATEIFNRINTERTKNGLGILGYDDQLQATADLRAKESAVSFGHTRPDGSAAVTAVTVDYNVAGENLIQVTKEFATVDIIVETWLASASHKANIMLADFSQTAIGIYESNGTLFISQIFTD